ncbi:hypothetical protein J8I88_14915 [Duffyella gerundensis]|uniref:hypothetical protein n=1 Tax=Duffyella gerundensis TaxID=1619313 RepID=UPI001AEAB1B2|nr:hypothetical protein [Duffyella gerundensis]QTO53803.1 hypothetical protein J8I88_14915 [Duffyella gerundensis]
MQQDEFSNPFIRMATNKVRESLNLIFMLSTQAKDTDKKFYFNEDGRRSMGWPPHITNMYKYRMMWDVDYNRLFHMCIISNCSELEFFFKELFDKYNHLPDKENNFFQKFWLVVKELEKSGVDFTPVQQDIELVKIAFQVRHIAIHNMSIVDKRFQRHTNGLGTLGQPFPVDDKLVGDIGSATTNILKHLDGALPPLSS